MMKRRWMQLGILVIAFFLMITVYLLHQPRKEPKIEAIVEKKAKKKKNLVSLFNPIDFESYWTINDEVYAFLYIKDTTIDNPVLQNAEDNRYYLDHMIDGVQAYPGAIFSEKETDKDFTDPNTILYGHNDIVGESMMNGITKFAYPTFFQQHPFIYIYTPTEILQYEVFAAYPYDNRHLLYTYDFHDRSIFRSYLEEVQSIENGNINHEVQVDENNKILTLSTCATEGEGRFLLQAVLKNRIKCAFGSSIEIEAPGFVNAKS